MLGSAAVSLRRPVLQVRVCCVWISFRLKFNTAILRSVRTTNGEQFDGTRRRVQLVRFESQMPRSPTNLFRICFVVSYRRHMITFNTAGGHLNNAHCAMRAVVDLVVGVHGLRLAGAKDPRDVRKGFVLPLRSFSFICRIGLYDVSQCVRQKLNNASFSLAAARNSATSRGKRARSQLGAGAATRRNGKGTHTSHNRSRAVLSV
jgi:hypothetical protein